MSETDPTQPSPAGGDASSPDRDKTAAGNDAGPGRRRPGIRGLLSQIREAGREVAAIARGKPIDSLDAPDEEPGAQAPADETPDKSNWRISMLHAAAERMRGAADNYIAAKLDEIEARVDTKLDHVEQRIDAKMIELHRQLRKMRDRELRHRLRLLKITLIVTVLVALLSLGYKLLAKYLGS
jgi:hypothetical protein